MHTTVQYLSRAFVPLAPPLPVNGFQPLNTSVRKPLSAALQTFTGFVPQRVPTALDAQGFWPQSPHAVGKRVPASSQQFEARPPGRVPTALDVQGFFPSAEPRFAKSFPVTAQQFIARALNVPGPIEGWRSDLAFRFIAPLPASQQQFSAWRFDLIPDPAPIVPPPPGHGSYPLKKIPSVRPIWDRGPEKQVLPAIVARALLVEADDTAQASGRIRIRARADITEMDDIARSALRVVWEDDELILQMLLDGDL